MNQFIPILKVYEPGTEPSAMRSESVAGPDPATVAPVERRSSPTDNAPGATLSCAKASKVESGMAESLRARKTNNRRAGLVSRLRGGRTPHGEMDGNDKAAPISPIISAEA
jgi:hypothetical protein